MHIKHILIVDDDDAFLKLLAKQLNRQDFAVETEINCDKAFERLSQQKFHFVIADYRMPKTDGIEFLNRVEAIQPDVTRILLSGMTAMRELQDRLKQAGIDYIVDKNNCFIELKSLLSALGSKADQFHTTV